MNRSKKKKKLKQKPGYLGKPHTTSNRLITTSTLPHACIGTIVLARYHFIPKVWVGDGVILALVCVPARKMEVIHSWPCGRRRGNAEGAGPRAKRVSTVVTNSNISSKVCMRLPCMRARRALRPSFHPFTVQLAHRVWSSRLFFSPSPTPSPLPDQSGCVRATKKKPHFWQTSILPLP
jgi:hypothetical protein